ncbi:MAG: hypothetical protein DRI34_05240 [Deltaproteobacteria bacterium]|nr:MAG: hypothetical protein DRI34_05240 [Deltaproteobacteria bacterium]
MPARKRAYHRPRLRGQRARSLDPAAAARRCELARAYAGAGQAEAAMRVMRAAVVYDAGNAGLRLRLAEYLYRAGRLEQALAWLAGSPAGSRRSALEAEILLDLQRWRQARRAVARALRQSPRDQQLRLRLAASLLEAGHPPEALDLLEHEFSRQLLPRAGRLRLAALAAGGHFEKVLEQLAGVPDPAGDVELVLLHLEAARHSGRPDREQADILAAGLRRFPRDPQLLMAQARLLAERRHADPAAAEQALGILERLAARAADDSQRAACLFLQADLLAERSDGQARAEVLYHRGLQLCPDHPRGLAGLGRLLVEAGRPAAGLPWLLQAVVANPAELEPLHWLALGLARLADDEAVARWLGLLLAALPTQAPSALAQLLRSVQEAGRQEAHQEVTREAHRMKNLLAVAASRLERGSAGQRELERLFGQWTEFLEHIRQPGTRAGRHSLRALLRQVVAEVCDDPARVRLALEPSLPPLPGHEQQLRAALANIIRNAWQASPPGVPVLVAARAPSAGWIEIAVTDRGPGIELSRQRHLFEPGYTTRPDGSGMGLAIARQVIQNHGGRLSVLSAPGGPTTFTIRLPAERWAGDNDAAGLVAARLNRQADHG